jgi:hypothetical protein
VGQSELRRGVEGATRPARAHARAGGSGGRRAAAGARARARGGGGGGRDSAYRDLIEEFPNVNLDSGLACKSEISVALRADLNGPLAVVLPSGVWAV